MFQTTNQIVREHHSAWTTSDAQSSNHLGPQIFNLRSHPNTPEWNLIFFVENPANTDPLVGKHLNLHEMQGVNPCLRLLKKAPVYDS